MSSSRFSASESAMPRRATTSAGLSKRRIWRNTSASGIGRCARSRAFKYEGRKQKAEGRRQKAEGRRQKAEVRLPSACCLLPSALRNDFRGRDGFLANDRIFSGEARSAVARAARGVEHALFRQIAERVGADELPELLDRL